jgi:hypothetical protein
MAVTSELISVISALCKDALYGKLKLEEFYKRWPHEADSDPFLRQLYEDIEDGVQHTPGFVFKQNVDLDAWGKSREYLVLYLDLSLLNLNEDTERLARRRSAIIQTTHLTKQTIDTQVAREKS